MKMFVQAARPLLSDLLATLVFAAAAALTRSAVVAAGLAMAVALVQLALAWRAGRGVGALQWLSLGLVMVFGAASVATHDLRFVMFKPTLVYAVVAAAMLQRGWMTRYMPAVVLAHVRPGVIEAWGYVWAGLMALTAALNAVVAGFAGVAAWGLFIGVFPLASKAGLFLLQYGAIRVAAVRRARAGRFEPEAAAA